MKVKPLIILSLIYVCAFAQSEKNAERRIGLFYSSDYAYRMLKSRDKSEGSNIAINARNDLEKPLYGFNTGFLISWKFSKRMELQAGIAYSLKGYQIKKQEVIFGDQIDPRTGVVYQNTASTSTAFSFKYKYEFIELPVFINFYLLQKNKFSLAVKAGIAPALLVKKTTVLNEYYEDGTKERKILTDDEVSYNKFNLNGITSIGIGYDINKKLQLIVQPQFQYYFISTTANTSIIEKLYSAGINININYTF